MQHTAYIRFFVAIAALFLLLNPGKGYAQYAYNYAPQPKEASAAADPEESKTPATGATKLVHGVIQNEQGALPGATVWLQGSRNIVVTNAEGEFELQVPADAKTVKLSCSYGGLQEEVLTLTPVQSMGSIYLLHTKRTKN